MVFPTWSSPGGIGFPRENLPHKPLPPNFLVDSERHDPPILVSRRRTVRSISIVGKLYCFNVDYKNNFTRNPLGKWSAVDGVSQ